MGKKEKMTIIGNSLEDVEKLRNPLERGEIWKGQKYNELSKEEIDVRKKEMLSKMNKKGKAKFEKTDKIRKKAKNQTETQAQNLKETINKGKITTKETKVKKLSEKLISKEFLGESMSLKNPKGKEKGDKVTTSITADKNILIKKIPEKIENTNESVKKHILITNTEKKQKILEKILSKKTEINAKMPGENLEENRDLYDLILQKFSNPQDEEEIKIIERATKNLEKITEVENLLEQFQALSEEKNISISDETKKAKKLVSKETLENIAKKILNIEKLSEDEEKIRKDKINDISKIIEKIANRGVEDKKVDIKQINPKDILKI